MTAQTLTDRATRHQAAMAYIDTDLLCYRAPEPPELAALQAERWQPIIEAAQIRYQCLFLTTEGVMPIRQPAQTHQALHAALEALDDETLLRTQIATEITGSLLLGLGLATRQLSPGAAFDAAFLDETFHQEQWGQDEELQARLNHIREELARL